MIDPRMPLAKTMPSPLIYIRHGETDWNKEGRLQGGQDIDINQTGKTQAKRNGQHLAEFLKEIGKSADDFRFVASPLTRTRETMEIVRTQLGLDPKAYQTDDRLKEITFGILEGKTLPEVHEEFPNVLERRRQDKWGYVHPGGESYKMLSYRIAGWMADQREPMIVVAHGAVMRVLRGLLCGYPAAEVPDLDTPQDQFLFWQSGKERWV